MFRNTQFSVGVEGLNRCSVRDNASYPERDNILITVDRLLLHG